MTAQQYGKHEDKKNAEKASKEANSSGSLDSKTEGYFECYGGLHQAQEVPSLFVKQGVSPLQSH